MQQKKIRGFSRYDGMKVATGLSDHKWTNILMLTIVSSPGHDYPMLDLHEQLDLGIIFYSTFYFLISIMLVLYHGQYFQCHVLHSFLIS